MPHYGRKGGKNTAGKIKVGKGQDQRGCSMPVPMGHQGTKPKPTIKRVD